MNSPAPVLSPTSAVSLTTRLWLMSPLTRCWHHSGGSAAMRCCCVSAISPTARSSISSTPGPVISTPAMRTAWALRLTPHLMRWSENIWLRTVPFNLFTEIEIERCGCRFLNIARHTVAPPLAQPCQHFGKVPEGCRTFMHRCRK